jgi:hypothetical protein
VKEPLDSGRSRGKWILAAVVIPLFFLAWWAFRPEKLFINHRVNEPAPSASRTEARPLYTRWLEGRAHPTSGRATIYLASDGTRYLRLTDFMTSNGPDVHVVLARGDDKDLRQGIPKHDLDRIELGVMKGNQGDQNYTLPASVDLRKYNAVVIYCVRFRAIFGVAPTGHQS